MPSRLEAADKGLLLVQTRSGCCSHRSPSELRAAVREKAPCTTALTAMLRPIEDWTESNIDWIVLLSQKESVAWCRPHYVWSIYLQVVNQKFIKSRIGVQVDQEALVLSDLDPWWLQRDSHALQLLLTLLQRTMTAVNQSNLTGSVRMLLLTCALSFVLFHFSHLCLRYFS